MTASQIIDEIKSLTPEEQAGVVRFVYQLDAERLESRLVKGNRSVEILDGYEDVVEQEFTSFVSRLIGNRFWPSGALARSLKPKTCVSMGAG